MKWAVVLFVICNLVLNVVSDTPANCTHEQLTGDWNFHFTQGGNDRNIDCTKPGPIVLTIPFKLHGRDRVVKLSDGEHGHYNLIYNQGFEVIVGFRKMFAFFKYTALNSTEFDCDSTMYGWAHDSNGRDWSCFYGEKVSKSEEKLKFTPTNENKEKDLTAEDLANMQTLLKEVKYHTRSEIIEEINSSQKS